MTMIRKAVLRDFHRFFHATPAVSLRRKDRVVANIESHPFHKIIKHIRPDDLHFLDPRRTLDLQPLDKVDPNWLKYEFQPFSDVLDSLPEDHRKIFTVAFGQRRDGMKIILEDMLEKTVPHKFDNDSLEFKVTWATWRIRNSQDLFRTNPLVCKSPRFKQNMKMLVDKRKKWLNQMRHADYKRFEWIIEILGVMYKNRPKYTRIERKASINVLVNLYCNEIREKKMAEYKAELEAEKVPFLQMKLETLMNIREEEVSVGVPSSVDDDIRSTRKILQDLEKSHMTIHPANVSSADDNTKSISSN